VEETVADQPFIGEIRMFGGNFAPTGWALCNGQQLAIAQNAALFSLLGTTYGGDGVKTFNLPNLQSRVPIHFGQSPGNVLNTYPQGQMGGVETVTLTGDQIPPHTHAPPACSSGNGTTDNPSGNYWAASGSNPAARVYNNQSAPDSTMNGGCVARTGGSQPHDNMLPYLCVNFIIALQGVFPSRN
jgi:microcystin-dependent protein